MQDAEGQEAGPLAHSESSRSLPATFLQVAKLKYPIVWYICVLTYNSTHTERFSPTGCHVSASHVIQNLLNFQTKPFFPFTANQYVPLLPITTGKIANVLQL